MLAARPHRLIDLLLVCYAAGALWLTFGPAPAMPVATFTVHLHQNATVAADGTGGASGTSTADAGRDWGRTIQWSSIDTERGANVLLFIPAGLLPLLRWRRLSPWWLLGALVAGSMTIELLQWTVATHRHASVVDVLTNGTGAAIGVGLGAWIRARVDASRASDRTAPSTMDEGAAGQRSRPAAQGEATPSQSSV